MHLDLFGAWTAGATPSRGHALVLKHLEHICLKQSFGIASIELAVELVNFHFSIYHYPSFFTWNYELVFVALIYLDNLK